MNTVLKSTDSGRDYFWFPFHPAFRWPMRLLGGALLAWGVAEIVRGHGWRFSALGQGIFLVLASLEQPYRRRKTRRDRIAFWFLQVLFLAVAAGAGWIAFQYATDRL